MAHLEFPRETSIILRCAGEAGNTFHTKKGNRLSCRDQEGRRGSEEAVPGPSVFPSGDPDPGENARSWEALGEARPGQSSLSAGALRYRAWAQSWSSAAYEKLGILWRWEGPLGTPLGLF